MATEDLQPATTSGVFFAHHGAFPGEEGRTACGRYPWAHCSHAVAVISLSLNRCVLVVCRKRRPPPDTLWSLRSESHGLPRALRRVASTRRHWPSSDAYPQVLRPGTTWDLVGQVFTSFSPGETTKHPHVSPVDNRPPHGQRLKENQPQRFRRVRTLAHTRGRNVTPPGVSRPGHFVAALAGRPWLRTPPKGEFGP